MNILIAGSSGFVGTALVEHLKKEYKVFRLVRKSPKKEDEIFWDPYLKKIDLARLEHCEVVINLCGESILGRWTASKKERIYESRIQPTLFLAETLAKTFTPKTFIQASAVGYYGSKDVETFVEESACGDDFLAGVCRDWEEATNALQGKSRVIFARLGVVLSPKGGALKAMIPAFKLGLGGKLGSGKQYVSWISLEDLVRAFEFLMLNAQISGPVNCVSPFPITNEQMTELLGKYLKRPTFFTIPESLLNFFLAEGAQFFLSGTKVMPRKLLENHFTFKYPKLESALETQLAT